jgi:hypothetical protein
MSLLNVALIAALGLTAEAPFAGTVETTRGTFSMKLPRAAGPVPNPALMVVETVAVTASMIDIVFED